MRKLKFEQPKCAPCEQVDKWLKDNKVEVEHINAWDQPDMARQYKVHGCPTIVVVDNNNKEVFRTVGFKPDQLKELKNL